MIARTGGYAERGLQGFGFWALRATHGQTRQWCDTAGRHSAALCGIAKEGLRVRIGIVCGLRLSIDRAQLAIFDAKWAAQRPVLDDQDRPLSRSDYTDEEWLMRILRFSALPGTSRHHWGTDIDVYDPSLLPNGQALRLVPSEYGEEGCFAALTAWIDRQIETDSAEGFSRPYDHDRGGVAVEPWHLSYLPQASLLSKWVTPEALSELWMQAPDLRPQCYKLVADRLGPIFDQYVVS